MYHSVDVPNRSIYFTHDYYRHDYEDEILQHWIDKDCVRDRDKYVRYSKAFFNMLFQLFQFYRCDENKSRFESHDPFNFRISFFI